MMQNKQIPAGYKDSPLGVIPAEWEVKKLGEVAKIYVGKDLKEDHFSVTKTDKHIYKVYSNTVQEKGLYGYYDIEEYGKNAVTVIGRGVGLGTAFARDDSFGAIGRLLVLYSDVLDYRFLSEYINTRVNILVESAAIPQLTGEQISTYKVLAPPLPEQQRIAEVLGTWDQGIELQAKLIESLQKRKRALMQQLLTGKKRLKGFDQAWKKVKLGEVADMKSGGTPSSNNKSYYDGNIPWVVIADITKANKYIYRTEKLITQDGLTNSSAKILPINTVLYAMYASIGKTAISKVPLATNQAILGITPLKDKLLSEYLYYILDNIEGNVKLLGQSGTQSNLNKEMVKDFNFVIPSLPEQQAIAEILTAADREIELAQKKLEVLREQKRGLMQQLLTGKKRLKV